MTHGQEVNYIIRLESLSEIKLLRDELEKIKKPKKETLELVSSLSYVLESHDYEDIH